MKKIFCGLCCIAAITGCHDPQTSIQLQPATAVSVVIDLTDKKQVWPIPNPVLSLFACEQHSDAQCSFTLSVITDKKLNPSYTSFLPDGSVTEAINKDDDAQFRNKNISDFYAAVRKNFTDAYKVFDTTRTLPYSECWTTINAALQALAENKSQTKYLIIASDLMEKSDMLDAYKALSHKSVQAIADILSKAYPSPQHLNGITVLILYLPKTREEDKRFNTMFEVYRILLQKNGATVKEQATNDFNTI